MGKEAILKAKNLGGFFFYLLLMFIYHLLPKCEVITGKSQTEVSLGQ